MAAKKGAAVKKTKKTDVKKSAAAKNSVQASMTLLDHWHPVFPRGPR